MERAQHFETRTDAKLQLDKAKKFMAPKLYRDAIIVEI
tara:strand:+ start:2177 stop:2290 length:114 start_codon:yes stop_codon:yes gene_type:complete